MNDRETSVGFFGKLPQTGDFVRRNLPGDFVGPWDAWLQQGLKSSREQLGSSWLDCYLKAPFWRFALTPGLCGQSPWIGVMMPSVDRVGRYFPLTVAAREPIEINLIEHVDHATEWLEAVERAMLHILEDESSNVADFTSALERLRVPRPEPSHVSTARHRALDSSVWFEVSLRQNDPARLAWPELFSALSLDSFSLWWSHGSEHVRPCLRWFPGLPDADEFWRLLTSEAFTPTAVNGAAPHAP